MNQYYHSKIDAVRAIIGQAPSFREFLRTFVIGDEGIEELDKLSDLSQLFVFSGVIRDYLTGEYQGDVRDLDLTISYIHNKGIIETLRRYQYRKNSFGGLKIQKGDLTIDIWLLNHTWGIKKYKYKPNPNNLLKSAFFNFSAIVYDYKNRNFIFSEEFIDFIISRKMEIVMPENPNIPLCLFNIVYYNWKYGFEIGDSIKNWIREHDFHSIDFEGIQNRHLGNVIIPAKEIIYRLNLFSK